MKPDRKQVEAWLERELAWTPCEEPRVIGLCRALLAAWDVIEQGIVVAEQVAGNFAVGSGADHYAALGANCVKMELEQLSAAVLAQARGTETKEPT